MFVFPLTSSFLPLCCLTPKKLNVLFFFFVFCLSDFLPLFRLPYSCPHLAKLPSLQFLSYSIFPLCGMPPSHFLSFSSFMSLDYAVVDFFLSSQCGFVFQQFSRPLLTSHWPPWPQNGGATQYAGWWRIQTIGPFFPQRRLAVDFINPRE